MLLGSHESKATTAVLNEPKVKAAYIPGGCTKFIQVPDVSWNKPFKENIRPQYEHWMVNERWQYTSAGNPKLPALELVLEWMANAWQSLSKDLIVKSFTACALTIPVDGSRDDQIACFHPRASIGPKGLEILRQVQAEVLAGDGWADYKAASLDDDKEESEEIVHDDELLMIQIP